MTDGPAGPFSQLPAVNLTLPMDVFTSCVIVIGAQAAAEELDVGDQFGRSPLMYCVLADRPECAEILIKAGGQVNLKDKGGRTALHWAAHKGNLRLMKLLLTRGADCREKDNEGQTALHLCTRHKLPKVMALLLRQLTPGEIDDQDKNKRTALHWAASHGNLEHVKMLIKQNSNIGIPDTEGKTPLHWAASSQDREALSCVKLVLETTPSVINWQDYEGRTALHLAVADGNESVVNVLTSVKNVNVSALDNMFRTPLHWAAVLGHSKIVSILLDSGADSASSDANGATPLHYAAQNNYSETVSVFLSRHLTDEPDLEGRTAFMWAAGTGADDVIRASLSAGVDIQQEDKTGGTGLDVDTESICFVICPALHAAALSGHSSTVKLLLDSRARLEVTDQAKHTPLFRACEMGHMDVVQTLIDYGARVDGLDQDGRSPLHWAALGGHAYICQMLIKYGDGPNVRDHSARAPLHCAAYGGFVNCMSALMEHGAEPNAQDREGMTCLHWACSKGHLDAVKLLVEYNAFPNHMEFTEDRYTPLDYALMGEHHEVAQYMIEQGALSITGIQDIAAQKIQCAFRGYRVRKAFIERKKLLMKHEKLKKEAARKRAAEEGKKAVDDKKAVQSNGNSSGTTPQSQGEILDSNQDLSAFIQQQQQQQHQQQPQQQDDQPIHETDGASTLSKKVTEETRQDPRGKSITESEEAALRGEQDQSCHHHQSLQKDTEWEPQHLTSVQELKLQPQQQQEQQKEVDKHTQMLRRSRQKMRKSEERRRKLLEKEENPENKEEDDQQQQQVPLDDPPQNPQHQYQERQQQCLHTQDVQESLEQEQGREKPAEKIEQLKKHRSRSRRKRRSRSHDSTGTADIHREKHRDKSSENQKENENPVVSPLKSKQGSVGEIEHHRRRRSRRHKDQTEGGRSHSPILPPSPRKESQTPLSSPRKEDLRKKEDTHLPALVTEHCEFETIGPTSEVDTSRLPSPLPQRENSASPSSSPFPAGYQEGSQDHYHHRHQRHHRDQDGHQSRRHSRHRRSRHEIQEVDPESGLGERADQGTKSVCPERIENREKHHRHGSRKHRGEADGKLRGGSSSHRKSQDREKLIDHGLMRTKDDMDKDVSLEKTDIASPERDHEDKYGSESGIDSAESNEQACLTKSLGTDVPHSDHCQGMEKQGQQRENLQQHRQQKQQQQQQQQEEEIRQAQLRKRELSKRYQGERMHSSHQQKQRHSAQNSSRSTIEEDLSSKVQRTSTVFESTTKSNMSPRR
ncbi:inversin [Elysia marginata]|uniref:Inversin n=1 Tax=Elysia marginata TaxID=1093978 RepID=A0AAV4FAN1_9GAST|nr:inversin [Elysia marginata]